jgi:hypothetical protein
MSLVAALVLLVASSTLTADASRVTPFSASVPGSGLPPGWRPLTLPRVKPAEIGLVAVDGATVLRVRSDHAAGSAAHALHADPARRGTLAWRWKIDRVVHGADLARKSGDDFAARVYVFFDVPVEELSLGERLTLKLARLLHGEDLPTAGICYVWDNRHPVGTLAPNPYAARIRTMVLQSGPAQAGRWTAERRDLEADFRTAFGSARATVPRVTGIAAGNDTDQTGEAVTAWFGDFTLGARP